ncbi:serine hydrolase domain-containing protein [Aliikangiella maris]|uniref:Serine hydrolase n=2 Tax=Aliikangiella maris TaxID=3162458 RepID=A0ABV2BPY7_9GAMM
MKKNFSSKSISKVYSTFVTLLLITNLGCNSSDKDTPVAQYEYQPPIQLNDGWSISNYSQLNLDPTKINQLINHIQQKDDGFLYIDSISIAHQGHLILDHRIRNQLDFADGWANNKNIELHVLNSVTKSFTSALVGIAIDQNIIPSVDVKVHDYFSHKQPIDNWTTEKQNITLENWLNMRAGYDWDEWNILYLQEDNILTHMNNSSDPVKFVLDRPMATQPGEQFAYSTGVSYVIGRLLQIASGSSVEQFLQQNLLAPLQITDFTFWRLDGQLNTGSALYLKARDMLKLGQLYLSGGIWNGQRIISAQWINQSTQQRVDLREDRSVGYGYHWWMTKFTVNGQTFSSYYADGFGGQYIFVIPQLDLVVALTGSAYQEGQVEHRSIRNILQQYILPTFAP